MKQQAQREHQKDGQSQRQSRAKEKNSPAQDRIAF
jgi:hypothetical protein